MALLTGRAIIFKYECIYRIFLIFIYYYIVYL